MLEESSLYMNYYFFDMKGKKLHQILIGQDREQTALVRHHFFFI